MKKLKLTALQFGATEVLTRAQLKNVLGGSGGGCSTSPCTTSGPFGQSTGYCSNHGVQGGLCNCITPTGSGDLSNCNV